MDDRQIIVFSMDGTTEHVGVLESETDDYYMINNVFTFAKQYDSSGKIVVNVVPFVLNSCGIKKVYIMKSKIIWYSLDVDDKFKKQFLASLSDIVVADSSTLTKLKKSNIVDINSLKK